MTPDVRAAHLAQQAAIPAEELTETDTTLGGTVKSGCSQSYSPTRATQYHPLAEIPDLYDIIGLADGAM
jgi:hypothetical protein